MDKKQSRLRRATQTRAKIAELKATRLSGTVLINTSTQTSSANANVVASASTVETEVRAELAGKLVTVVMLRQRCNNFDWQARCRKSVESRSY